MLARRHPIQCPLAKGIGAHSVLGWHPWRSKALSVHARPTQAPSTQTLEAAPARREQCRARKGRGAGMDRGSIRPLLWRVFPHGDILHSPVRNHEGDALLVVRRLVDKHGVEGLLSHVRGGRIHGERLPEGDAGAVGALKDCVALLEWHVELPHALESGVDVGGDVAISLRVVKGVHACVCAQWDVGLERSARVSTALVVQLHVRQRVEDQFSRFVQERGDHGGVCAGPNLHRHSTPSNGREQRHVIHVRPQGDAHLWVEGGEVRGELEGKGVLGVHAQEHASVGGGAVEVKDEVALWVG
mmetsp:Transcript_3761/g.9521  ORF Transcript_3761/g.9521 Transcript_3761/m.9521 type:complete len:300 (-) Transcript_3761:23-922(-)